MKRFTQSDLSKCPAIPAISLSPSPYYYLFFVDFGVKQDWFMHVLLLTAVSAVKLTCTKTMLIEYIRSSCSCLLFSLSVLMLAVVVLNIRYLNFLLYMLIYYWVCSQTQARSYILLNIVFLFLFFFCTCTKIRNNNTFGIFFFPFQLMCAFALQNKSNFNGNNAPKKFGELILFITQQLISDDKICMRKEIKTYFF